jgi:hypothetical protein
MELFTATGKPKKIFLTTRDVRCVHRVSACGNNLNIVSMCAMSPVVHKSNISSCQNNFFSFPVTVKNSIKVGPLAFLL